MSEKEGCIARIEIRPWICLFFYTDLVTNVTRLIEIRPLQNAEVATQNAKAGITAVKIGRKRPGNNKKTLTLI